MAQLLGSSLSGCLYIPGFIPAGTVTVFSNTSCTPTSWVKDTTTAGLDNSALRVVSGSVTVTTNQAMSTLLSSSVTWGPSPITAIPTVPISLNPNPANISVSPSSVTYSHGPAVAQLAAHTHDYNANPNNTRATGPATYAVLQNGTQNVQNQAHGGGVAHTHTTTSSDHNHGLTFPVSQTHTHTLTTGSHSHTFTGSAPFNVSYTDVIIATKQ